MMNVKECANAWKTVVSIYKDTDTQTALPKETMRQIVDKLGIEDTYTVFSTVAKIKEWDGRIYGIARETMNATPYVPEAVVNSSGNIMMYAGLDEIHSAHINQLIEALIEIKAESEV